jgi:hypothetical protein
MRNSRTWPVEKLKKNLRHKSFSFETFYNKLMSVTTLSLLSDFPLCLFRS